MPSHLVKFESAFYLNDSFFPGDPKYREETNFSKKRDCTGMENDLKREKRLINDLSELSAISEAFLTKFDDINKTLKELDFSGEDDDIVRKFESLKKVIDSLVANEKSLKNYKTIVQERVNSLRQAIILEDFGDYNGAARVYALSGEYFKAARLYQKAHNYQKAGDAYFSAGNFKKAIKMYEKTGDQTEKLALAYEKVARYRQAAMVWKQLGKIAESRRCMQKVNQLSLFDI